MSQLPDSIEGLGKASDKLRPNPSFDPGSHPFDRDSYFVWSRIDGVTTLRDIVLMVGFPVDHTLGILRALRESGALLLPGESPASVTTRLAATTARSPAVSAAASVASTPPDGSRLTPPASDQASQADDELTAEEEAAMAAESSLAAESRKHILAMRRRLRTADYFTFLGVPRNADARAVKQAYRRLSKEFHPDRYYGRDTGPFGPFLAEIFEALTRAFDTLSDDKGRSEYIARLTGSAHSARTRPQTQAEYAAELFERACQQETRGDKARALELFAAAIRIDAQPRYWRRAALCALAAHRLIEAEEYSSKAANLDPNDPSVLRLLANVYRALGKLRQAEQTLLSALALESENDALVSELQGDLAEVQNALAGNQG